jgi:hypothetical protein
LYDIHLGVKITGPYYTYILYQPPPPEYLLTQYCTAARRPPHPSYTQQHYTTALGYIKQPMYLLFLWLLSRLFWAQIALASLVPFQGPKKSRFSGPTPSNNPRNDVAPLKIITYRAIKTTGTLIVKVDRQMKVGQAVTLTLWLEYVV